MSLVTDEGKEFDMYSDDTVIGLGTVTNHIDEGKELRISETKNCENKKADNINLSRNTSPVSQNSSSTSFLNPPFSNHDIEIDSCIIETDPYLHSSWPPYLKSRIMRFKLPRLQKKGDSTHASIKVKHTAGIKSSSNNNKKDNISIPPTMKSISKESKHAYPPKQILLWLQGTPRIRDNWALFLGKLLQFLVKIIIK